VWAVAGDPATISEWLPAIATSSVDGVQRSCTTVDGADLHERNGLESVRSQVERG